MEALILIIRNTVKKTYHPIVYYENPFPDEDNPKLIYYRSVGHHGIGFKNKPDAVNHVTTKMLERLKSIGCQTIHLELDDYLNWDGVGIPPDLKIRNRIK